MNIRQLQFFYRAAQEGSLSAAARAENVTVQAISKAVLELEAELGEPLFHRAGKGVTPTQLGEALLGPVREAVASFDAVGRSVEAWRTAGGDRDDLRIALVTPPFAKQELICGVIARLMTRMLGVATHLNVAVGADALADLRAGTLDALFTIGRLHHPGCACVPIGTVSPGVFMGKDHPLRRKKLLTFADLAPYPVLYSDDVDGFNETVLLTCRKHGLASPLYKVGTDEGVMEFLEQRNGVIMGVNLKELSIKPFAFMRPLDPAEAPSIPVCMVTMEGGRREVVDRLDNFVRNEFRLLRHVLDTEEAAGTR